MKKDDLVSVIIPVYKVEKYLDQCVESIVKQTYPDLEIILVDDGSPDRCPLMCEDWQRRDTRIAVVHKANGGLSSARNAGLDICRGEYVCFIDSDDWIEPNYVERMLSAMMEEHADIISCSFVNEYEQSGKSVCKPKEFFSGGTEQALCLLYDQTRIVVAAMKFYKRKIWETMRFPEGRLYEDALTTYKAFDLADRIVQIPDGLYHYRIRENSIMTSAFSLKTVGISDAWKENYLFCRDHYPAAADLARAFWLEHIPPLIRQFPKEMKAEEKAEKERLKKEILDNIGFSLTHMPPKKFYHQVKALCSP